VNPHLPYLDSAHKNEVICKDFFIACVNVLPCYVGMMGTNVNNPIAFSLENWYKRQQSWWAFRGSANSNFVLLRNFVYSCGYAYESNSMKLRNFANAWF